MERNMALNRNGKALKDRAGKPAERLALVLCGALVMALLIGFHVEARKNQPARVTVAHTAQSCKPISRHEPCLAPIQSFYAYAGEGGGDVTYIHARAGKKKVVGQVYEETPRPGLWQVTKRTFTWHSVAGVTIVAVFVETGGGIHPFVYRRVPSGPHSGHTTLTAIFDNTTPGLLLEGRRIQTSTQAKAATANTRCQSDFRGVPCLGPIESSYAYNGYGSDQTSKLWAKPGPTEKVGERFETNPFPRDYEVTQRTFTWHSRSNIEIVAVYVIHRPLRSHPTYQRLSTGPHSGHATLTDVADQTSPLLLMEGRRGQHN